MSIIADSRSRARALALAVTLASCPCGWRPPLRAAEGPGASAGRDAARILESSGVRGGLVLHLGCGDGKLTTALRANESFTVLGLDPDAARVAAARKLAARRGLQGAVSFDLLAAPDLPCADNLVNLVVAERPAGVPESEILRVLAPGGVACVKKQDGWKTSVKPRPESMDEWSHFLHDATNNAVAHDDAIGPPRSLQWSAPPLWLRSHETPSGIEGLVSAGGRIFYFFDEGLIGITDQRLPERWSLVARDAFNGKLLWKRPVRPWGWNQWAQDKFQEHDWTTIRGGRTVVPADNQRRLVAGRDRVYGVLGFGAPLSILDAATGEVLRAVKETGPVREILATGGVVIVHSRDLRAQWAARRGKGASMPSTLLAVDGASGKILWKKETAPIPSLFVAADGERVVYRSGSELQGADLHTGKTLWRVKAPRGKGRTLLLHDGVVIAYIANSVEARDGASGDRLWSRKVPPSAGSESPDLFVAGNTVWRGMVPISADRKPVGKSADAMAIGLDLRTGEEKRRVVVPRLRSPEHHHRCYRNKATDRYILSGMEGIELMDLEGSKSLQNNWLRGACRLGIMPCNGLIYVPADQCFCQPGAKVLGFVAVASGRPRRSAATPDAERLQRGEAFGSVPRGGPAAAAEDPDEWPTYRHDAARHGSTPAIVPPRVKRAWRARLGGTLTPPVAAGAHVYVADRDAHTIYAIDRNTGETAWKYVTGGRVDSPPTVYRGLVLAGSADGRVYCLRAADGKLAWSFLAAPRDLRIGCFDQFESVWPVHGSVLVHEGVAYVTAGRSTYLDGGIRFYGLDPFTGAVRYKTTLKGPFPDPATGRDKAFYLPGANSDVLVSEGGAIYMRQKKLTPDLREVVAPVLSSKGAQDVGLHVFSTASLLDASWYNRTFWMYGRRWPGFQLANQAPKSGQLLVADEKNTYAVRVFYRRNVHSPMFFPAREGYLLFADRNENEPQIVGEPGSRKPVEWLPQSNIPRSGNWGLDSKAFGLDKMIGYTRAEAPLWKRWLPIRIRAMVKTAGILFVAGPPDVLVPGDPYAAFEGRRGALLAAVSARDGEKLHEIELDALPVFDGLAAVAGRLYLSLKDGSLLCLEGTGGKGAAQHDR